MAARHVLTTMIADCLDDSVGSAVANREALAGHSSYIGLATRRPVQAHIADDDVRLRHESGAGWREHRDPAPGESLAQMIVGVAFEDERHAPRHEGAEALPCGALEMQANGVLGQPGGPVFASHFTAGNRADDPIHIADRHSRAHRDALLDSGLAQLEQRRDVQRFLQPVILIDLAEAADFGADIRLVEDVAEVEALGLPMVDGSAGHEPVDAPDHLLHGAEAQLRHDLAQVLRNEAHEIHDVLGRAGELLPQARILRRDACGAGVQVTDTHHDAAQRDQRRRGEPELLGAQQRGDGDVASCLQLPVGLHDDAAAQIVQHQRLVRLCQTQLPRQSGMRDRSLR